MSAVATASFAAALRTISVKKAPTSSVSSVSSAFFASSLPAASLSAVRVRYVRSLDGSAVHVWVDGVADAPFHELHVGTLERVELAKRAVARWRSCAPLSDAAVCPEPLFLEAVAFAQGEVARMELSCECFASHPAIVNAMCVDDEMPKCACAGGLASAATRHELTLQIAGADKPVCPMSGLRSNLESDWWGWHCTTKTAKEATQFMLERIFQEVDVEPTTEPATEPTTTEPAEPAEPAIDRCGDHFAFLSRDSDVASPSHPIVFDLKHRTLLRSMVLHKAAKFWKHGGTQSFPTIWAHQKGTFACTARTAPDQPWHSTQQLIAKTVQTEREMLPHMPWPASFHSALSRTELSTACLFCKTPFPDIADNIAANRAKIWASFCDFIRSETAEAQENKAVQLKKALKNTASTLAQKTTQSTQATIKAQAKAKTKEARVVSGRCSTRVVAKRAITQLVYETETNDADDLEERQTAKEETKDLRETTANRGIEVTDDADDEETDDEEANVLRQTTSNCGNRRNEVIDARGDSLVLKTVDTFATPRGRRWFHVKYLRAWFQLIQEHNPKYWLEEVDMSEVFKIRIACIASAWQGWGAVPTLLSCARDDIQFVRDLVPHDGDVTFAQSELQRFFSRETPKGIAPVIAAQLSLAVQHIHLRLDEIQSFIQWTVNDGVIELCDALLLPRDGKDEDSWDASDAAARREFRALKTAFFSFAELVVGEPLLQSNAHNTLDNKEKDKEKDKEEDKEKDLGKKRRREETFPWCMCEHG